MQGDCGAVAGERRTDEQVCELAQALERRGPLRPRRVGRDRGRERGAVVGDVDGGVGEKVERACGLARLLAAERREVKLRLGQREGWVVEGLVADGVQGDVRRCKEL